MRRARSDALTYREMLQAIAEPVQAIIDSPATMGDEDIEHLGEISELLENALKRV